MRRFALQIAAGILGIWLASKFVQFFPWVTPPGVKIEIIPGQSSFFGIDLTATWQIIIVIGAILGLVNSFIKPILKFITIPIRTLTLGLFTLIIDMALVWGVDVLFPELIIEGLIPLFWTTLVVGILSFFLLRFSR
jgi:putative membrane protein